MNRAFYLNQLYPFQELVLRELTAVDSGFYLSGGTALSRGYLDHRFSDDLDFFVDDNPQAIPEGYSRRTLPKDTPEGHRDGAGRCGTVPGKTVEMSVFGLNMR